jgi:hypothetical protein
MQMDRGIHGDLFLAQICAANALVRPCNRQRACPISYSQTPQASGTTSTPSPATKTQIWLCRSHSPSLQCRMLSPWTLPLPPPPAQPPAAEFKLKSEALNKELTPAENGARDQEARCLAGHREGKKLRQLRMPPRRSGLSSSWPFRTRPMPKSPTPKLPHRLPWWSRMRGSLTSRCPPLVPPIMLPVSQLNQTHVPIDSGLAVRKRPQVIPLTNIHMPF